KRPHRQDAAVEERQGDGHGWSLRRNQGGVGRVLRARSQGHEPRHRTAVEASRRALRTFRDSSGRAGRLAGWSAGGAGASAGDTATQWTLACTSMPAAWGLVTRRGSGERRWRLRGVIVASLWKGTEEKSAAASAEGVDRKAISQTGTRPCAPPMMSAQPP